jgi:hypothetical protein
MAFEFLRSEIPVVDYLLHFMNPNGLTFFENVIAGPTAVWACALLWLVNV